MVSVELPRRVAAITPSAPAPAGGRLPLRLCHSPSLCPECDEIWRWCGDGSDEPVLEPCPGCDEAF